MPAANSCTAARCAPQLHAWHMSCCHSPIATACMMRPGRNVKAPAITSAPKKMAIMTRRFFLHRMPARMPNGEREHDQRENRQQVNGTPRPPELISWMKKALTLTSVISPTQIQPTVR